MTTAAPASRVPDRPRRLVPAAWRNPINRVLNLALYLLSCFMVGTGLIMWLRLPPGSGGRHRGGRGEHAGETAHAVLGMSRHEWGDWHLYAGLALIGITALHLLMNWTWMRKIAGGEHAWRLWLGLAAGVGIVALLALAPAGA